MVKKPNLNESEKEIIQSIAASIGKSEVDVKEVFLALITHIALNMYEGESSFTIPYLFEFKLSTKREIGIKDVLVKEKYDVTTSEAFKKLIYKYETNQTSWLEEYFKSLIFKAINEKLL